MKLYPPPSPARRRSPPHRIPAFHPVPVAPRKDGWTPQRQGQFIGWLVQTRSFAAACRKVSMGRESAYRLRARPGAAGFAAAWDAALGVPHEPVDLSSAKSTGLPVWYRSEAGLLNVVLHQRRYVITLCKPDNIALSQHLAQLYRATRRMEGRGGKSHCLKPGYR